MRCGAPGRASFVVAACRIIHVLPVLPITVPLPHSAPTQPIPPLHPPCSIRTAGRHRGGAASGAAAAVGPPGDGVRPAQPRPQAAGLPTPADGAGHAVLSPRCCMQGCWSHAAGRPLHCKSGGVNACDTSTPAERSSSWSAEKRAALSTPGVRSSSPSCRLLTACPPPTSRVQA